MKHCVCPTRSMVLVLLSTCATSVALDVAITAPPTIPSILVSARDRQEQLKDVILSIFNTLDRLPRVVLCCYLQNGDSRQMQNPRADDGRQLLLLFSLSRALSISSKRRMLTAYCDSGENSPLNSPPAIFSLILNWRVIVLLSSSSHPHASSLKFSHFASPHQPPNRSLFSSFVAIRLSIVRFRARHA